MMKSKNILIAAGLGLVAYLLLKPKTTQRPATIPREYQTAPPRASAAFQNWATTILQVYGQSKWLFEPGGPFYNNKIMNEKYLNDILKQPIYDIPTTPTTPNNPYPGQGDYGDYG